MEDANDIVQDTAVVVLAHDHGPADAEQFVGWCCVVARHLALHRRRSEARALTFKESLQRSGSPLVDGDPERRLAVQRRLQVGLHRLDDEALSLLWSRFVLEETAVEVASRLNVSAVSVRMRLSRLLAAIRESETSTEGPLVDRYDLDDTGSD